MKPDRRLFLTRLAKVLGARIALPYLVPAGWVPVAMAADSTLLAGFGKPELSLLNDRPLNAETPAHLLDDPVTPASRLFVRNNGLPPVRVDADNWLLKVEGESVKQPQQYTLASLKKRFSSVSLQLVLECGGNGRAEFVPPASGNQWTTGAVGCPSWQGIRLRDLLEDVGVAEDAVYLGYYGADTHLSGDPKKSPISRGVPIAKALEAESLVAWGMNGQDLPALHGYPLRLIFGGWPGSTSGKWLTRIVLRNQVHDGAKMTGKSYRVPRQPVAPGTVVADTEMEIIESLPVKSLLTAPRTGHRHEFGKKLEVRGHAWAGDNEVSRVRVSLDFGQTWLDTVLDAPSNRLAWQRFKAELRFPEPGYYEIWAVASDSRGRSQPMVLPGWNPKGYLNNAAHRIAVYVA